MRRSVWLVVAVVALALPGPAHAAFPGTNGKIAFSGCAWNAEPGQGYPHNCEIYSTNPDGSGTVNLTNTPDGTSEGSPAWAPDGARIAYERDAQLWTVSASGTGAAPLPLSGTLGQPAWSPDGQKLAFVDSGDLYSAKLDGTDVTQLTGTADADAEPHWSPDGTRILFTRGGGPWIVNADGSGETEIGPDGVGDVQWSPDGARYAFTFEANVFTSPVTFLGWTQVTDNGQLNVAPDYSPDGTKVVYEQPQAAGDEPSVVRVAAADGSTDVPIAGGGFFSHATTPDWQPIPVNGYARPKGASQFRVSLVPAYRECTSPDRIHGPALEYPSCSSPQMVSDHVTIGTPDANGQTNRNVGYVRIQVFTGNPATPADEADISLAFLLTHAFAKSPFSEYGGELRARVPLRVTDKDNSPHPGGPGAATTTEIPLDVIAPCSPTINDPVDGAYCSMSTSADTLAPGAAKEGRRAIWGFGRIDVYDGGPDGDADTPAGDQLFATQGLFIP